MGEEIKKKILEFLRENPQKKFSITALTKEINSNSYPTILKWATALISEEKIRVEDYGSIKLVYFEDG